MTFYRTRAKSGRLIHFLLPEARLSEELVSNQSQTTPTSPDHCKLFADCIDAVASGGAVLTSDLGILLRHPPYHPTEVKDRRPLKSKTGVHDLMFSAVAKSQILDVAQRITLHKKEYKCPLTFS
jgi:hypothetical protein